MGAAARASTMYCALVLSIAIMATVQLFKLWPQFDRSAGPGETPLRGEKRNENSIILYLGRGRCSKLCAEVTSTVFIYVEHQEGDVQPDPMGEGNNIAWASQNENM